MNKVSKDLWGTQTAILCCLRFGSEITTIHKTGWTRQKFFIIYKSLRAICHLAERKHQSSPCLQQTTKEKKEEVTQVMPGEVRTMLRHPAGRKITGAALGFQ